MIKQPMPLIDLCTNKAREKQTNDEAFTNSSATDGVKTILIYPWLITAYCEPEIGTRYDSIKERTCFRDGLSFCPVLYAI